MPSDVPAGPTVLLVALGLTALATASTSAHPPDRTDHGVPESTFHTLWSGDADRVEAEGRTGPTGGSAIEELAARTDISFDAPPPAVPRWNRGDHREFPTSNRSVSIHPPTATLNDGRFLRDAYAAVFSVDPATRARLSGARQPLYAAPNGTLRGTVDYRVSVPPDTTSRDRRVSWRLESHGIEKTRVLVDGATVTNGSGSSTPSLDYALDGAGGTSHALTLAADIGVTLRKEVTVCTNRTGNGTCANWRTTVEYPTENLTVRDTVDVVAYRLAISGAIARYPNGDLGLVVAGTRPWLGHALPNGDVRGVWRFYTARDPDWDTLVYSRASGDRTKHSPLHPIRVSAYPIETGPTPTPRGRVAILDVDGRRLSPPTLPSAVTLDVHRKPYTASRRIVTRAATAERVATVRAWGLVRGVNASRPVEAFRRLRIHRSSLTVTVREATGTTLTVRITLRDRRTDAPIATAERGGYVVVNGQRVNTTGSGHATITLDRPPAGVSARYVPGRWWEETPGYTGDSDTVLVQGTALDIPAALSRLGVPLALFLLAGFLLDRITGWALWPPWGRL